jgi:hypothetical protein
MAQASTSSGPVNSKVTFTASNSVTVPGTGNTTLLQVKVQGLERIFVQLSATTQALDAFLIQGKAHADATALTLFSAGADFTSPAGLMIDASGDLTGLAASASGWFVMDVRGLYEVKILASAAADSATVAIYLGGM